MTIYPYPCWEPQSTSGLWWNLGHGLLRSKTETGQAALPGQDYMHPFGVIGVAPRYIPAGAVIELAGFRLSCTSTPTGIRETQAGGNRIQGHLSLGGPESRADSGSLIPWWSRIAHLSVKSHPGIAPGPSLTNTDSGWERVFFIGTQFSILYTSMYSPAGAASHHLSRGGPESRAFPSRVTRGLHPAPP